MTGTKIECKAPKYSVGQRVKREWATDEAATFAREPRKRQGSVKETYAIVGSAHGDYSEVYDVHWDGEVSISRGYLPHGIEAIEKGGEG